MTTPADFPPHVEDALRGVERLHAEHGRRASWADRVLDLFKAQISRPRFIVVLLAAVAIWMIANIAGPRTLPDPPPFQYLSLVLALGGVCLTVLVLATQWRADLLANHREKLILQLTSVSEQKTAKLIALIEELRRDSPEVPDRLDAEAQQMTEVTNVTAVSKALHGSSRPAPERDAD